MIRPPTLEQVTAAEIPQREIQTAPSKSRCLMVWLVAGLLLQGTVARPGMAAPYQTGSWQEGFEGNNVTLQWEVTTGLWAFGKPAIGPTNAFAGAVSAATGLQRDTPYRGSSTLISPPVAIPEKGEHPRLRYWQWFMLHPEAYGQVSVRLANGQVEALAPRFSGQAPVWSPAALDLAKYAGQTVQFLFDFAGYADINWPGWFIDELEVRSGGFFFGGFDDFEGSWGDWYAEHGNWSVGKPLIGPLGSVSGTNCAAVALRGDKLPIRVSGSSLLSPTIEVPPATLEPRLDFWHWFILHPEAYGRLSLLLENGQREELIPNFNGQAPGWTRVSQDLTRFAGQKIQFSFDFAGYADINWPGWYVDDVQLQFVPPVDIQAATVDFESGWGDWSVELGNWFIGTPAIGPSSGFASSNCVAVALQADRLPLIVNNSPLISPRFLVADAGSNPRLNFQHWFKIHPEAYAEVWVKLDDGKEELLSVRYTGDSSGWTSALLPLSKYAGKVVQFKFLFAGYLDSNWPAWFIDDIRLIPPVRNSRPVFAPAKAELAAPGEMLEIVVKAADTDAGQSLKYSVDTNTLPATAQFDPAAGKLSWTPTVEECSGPGYHIVFNATDDGTPPLRDILVVPVLPTLGKGAIAGQSEAIAPSLILADRKTSEGWALRLVGALPGLEYTLQSSSDLSLPWTDVVSRLTLVARGQVPRLVAPSPIPGGGQLFYRLRSEVSSDDPQ